MASKVISFRFGDVELEALQALQVPEDESVNQTAARLLRGLTGTSTVVSTSVDIRELVRQEVSAAIALFRREIDERLGQYSAHENAASVEQSPVSPSTTVDTSQQVQQLQEELEQLRSRNQELENENQQLQETIGNSVEPDYFYFRDRVLGKLKVGRQSAGGKAIEAFIKELLKSQPQYDKLSTSNPPTVSSSGELFDGEQEPKAPPTTAASLVKEAYKRSSQSNFQHTDVYENELNQIAAKCGLRLFRDIRGKHFYVTPMDNRSSKLITTSSIGGVAEFLSSQPLLAPPPNDIKHL